MARMNSDWGRWGGPNKTLEIYKDWRDEVLELKEAADGGNAEASKLLLEASPDTRADFATFLYGTVRHSFYQGYNRAAFNWKRYASKTSNQDFRENRLRGFNGMQGIGYVGELGERPLMRRSFRPEASVLVDTYGAEYAITRQAIRNDDTNQLVSRIPDDMGYAMGVFMQQTIIALVLANPVAADGLPIYSSSRPSNGGVAGNDATAFLSEDSLLDGIVWMQSQRDDDGRPINISAYTLVVQNERMAAVARRILNSQITGIRTDTAAMAPGQMAAGNINPLSNGGFLPGGVVVDTYFTSPHAWYLFANPDQQAAFTMAFLDGDEEPFIGMRQPQIRDAMSASEDPYSWDFRALEFIVESDFGAAPVDTRATYRSLAA